MKLFKLLTVLFTILVIGVTSCHSQTLVVKRDGTKGYVNAISSDSSVRDEPMGLYTDPKGVEYPMYRTKTKKVYIKRVSKKTGKEYKQYLKISK